MQWLEEDFIGYLDAWEARVQARIPEEGETFSDSQRQRMLLSAETRIGLRRTSRFRRANNCNADVTKASFLTAKSFVGLVRYLFSRPEVTENNLAFLSQNLCQDPLENFFGCQRQRRRTSDNPNVLEFYQNSQTLRVVNSFCRASVKGNCRGNETEKKESEESSSTPLPKRPRTK